jgi:mono/diheme cytochrome c family protein
MIFPVGGLAAQTNGGGASTNDGVYTREQAMRGQDVYAGNCKSCHTPESHAGVQFTSKWNGKPLLELYLYVRELMPKNDPGTLSAEEYADVVAYMLRMNRLPVGDNDLPVDTTALKGIRIRIAP